MNCNYIHIECFAGDLTSAHHIKYDEMEREKIRREECFDLPQVTGFFAIARFQAAVFVARK